MTETVEAPEAEWTPPEGVDAPFGWMRDRVTGEHRPKLRPGKGAARPAEDVTPRSQPSLDDLKAAKAGQAPVSDVTPGKSPKGKRKEAKPIPRHRPGFITKGMNKWYKRIGKIAKAMDADLGAAIIATTENDADEGEPDNSVGAAWDALAAVNPQVRRVLMSMLEGGVYGALFWAHAPIFMALLMKDAIRDKLPIGKLMMAFVGDDEPNVQGEETILGGMTQADMMQAAQVLAQQMMQMGVPGGET
jgi:hypothetical protein